MFPSFSTFVSTPTLNHYPKPQQLAPTMGLTRFNYVRSMAFQLASKFLSGSRMVFGSLLSNADNMGDLRLREPELWEITRLGTDRFPPTPARVGLTCKAQLRHRSNRSGKPELDPSRDNADHQEICCPVAADPIYKMPSESNSDGGQEVFMVGQRLPEQLIWSKKLIRHPRKGIMTSKMSQEHLRRKLRMVPPLEGTTPSSTVNVRPAATGSGFVLGRFMKKLAKLCGKVSRFTARLHTMLWPLGSYSIISHACHLRTVRR
jgi:hypothetical protein